MFWIPVLYLYYRGTLRSQAYVASQFRQPTAITAVNQNGERQTESPASPIYFDCPECGDTYSANDSVPIKVSCVACGTAFEGKQAINKRKTPQRAETQGWLSIMRYGPSIKRSRREMEEARQQRLRQEQEAARNAPMEQLNREIDYWKTAGLTASIRGDNMRALYCQNKVAELMKRAEWMADEESSESASEPAPARPTPEIRMVGPAGDVLSLSETRFDGTTILGVLEYRDKASFPNSISSSDILCRQYGPNRVIVGEARLTMPKVRKGERAEVEIRVRNVERVAYIEIAFSDEEDEDGQSDGCGPCKSCGQVFTMKFESAKCPKCGNQMSREDAFFACSSYKGSRPPIGRG